MPITKKQGYAGRTFVTTSSAIEKQIGFSRAVRDGNWIFVSNTSGSNYDTGTIADSPAEQAQQMLLNIENALTAAGGTVEDIVRATLYVAKPEYLPDIRPVVAQMIGRARPALTAVCSPLARENLKVEMEVTARIKA
jgi:enamine deaminase RidA (YjgF/YER057c/UK114 family)